MADKDLDDPFGEEARLLQEKDQGLRSDGQYAFDKHSLPASVIVKDEDGHKSELIGPLTQDAFRKSEAYSQLPPDAKAHVDKNLLNEEDPSMRFMIEREDGKTVRTYQGSHYSKGEEPVEFHMSLDKQIDMTGKEAGKITIPQGAENIRLNDYQRVTPENARDFLDQNEARRELERVLEQQEKQDKLQQMPMADNMRNALEQAKLALGGNHGIQLAESQGEQAGRTITPGVPGVDKGHGLA